MTTVRGSDGRRRCEWPNTDEMREYHDVEWGTPLADDRRHFQFLVLESAQSGLSWAIVWRKRDGYRKAFANWDFTAVARFDAARIEKMLQDPDIIRNRLKVSSAVNNSRALVETRREFGSFDAYIWRFAPAKARAPRALADIPAKTAESEALAKDLRKRGYAMVGPIVMYSHMQAVGLVNDHVVGCFRRSQVEALRVAHLKAGAKR
jgi:DNA-3-methyladenine glycosylase I